MAKAGITGDQVEYVIMGQVIQAGTGQITARQAAVKGGIPMTVPALTVNKVCLSGLNAIALADQLIGYGEFEIVVAGGMESMTNGPYLLPGLGRDTATATPRSSTPPRTTPCSARSTSAAWAPPPSLQQGQGITRAEQDEYAAMSHERATARAQERPVRRRDRSGARAAAQGDPLLVTEDEGVRPGTTAESLAKLRPAFAPDGTVTAGNASQISDGAAAVVVMSRARAEQLGLPVLAEIGAHGIVAGPDASLLSQPSNAIRKALDREGLSPDDVDLFEINEAFASWPSSRCATWASVRTWSTSTVAPSPWAIRSARPAPASRCISPSNSAAEAADSARPHCAVAAGRARPCCSASMPDPASTTTPKGSATWPTR